MIDCDAKILCLRTSLQAATAVLLIAGISFLGLGAQAPTPEWGAMLVQGRSFMCLAPLLVIVSAVESRSWSSD